MSVETFLGISIKHDDGTVQRFALASDECTVTEDLSEAMVGNQGKHIGKTSNQQWEYDVYLYRNEYYVSAGILAPEVFGNPPLMTRLLPLDDELSTIVNALANSRMGCQCRIGCSQCEPVFAFLKKHKHLIKKGT